MRKVGGGAIAQAVLPTGKSAYLAGAIGTVHVGRAQRMHKAIGPVAVERGHTKCHAQRTGPALVNNSQKDARQSEQTPRPVIASNPEPSQRRRMGCKIRSRSSNGIAGRWRPRAHRARAAHGCPGTGNSATTRPSSTRAAKAQSA